MMVFLISERRTITLKQELDGTRAYLETDTDEVSVVNAHLNDLPVQFSVCVNEGQDKLPTMYWLPKLHKRLYKARFIANSSSCTTTELSKLLTCLTAIKSHVIRYCETVYETSNKNWFWSIKNSGEVLSKLKCRGFRATSLSTYDFSTLYTTVPHNVIKEKLLDLIEWTLKRALKNYGSLYLACNDRKAFFTSSDQSRYTLWSCLIVSLVSSHLGFWSGKLFLIAPFPDLCLLVPFFSSQQNGNIQVEAPRNESIDVLKEQIKNVEIEMLKKGSTALSYACNSSKNIFKDHLHILLHRA